MVLCAGAAVDSTAWMKAESKFATETRATRVKDQTAQGKGNRDASWLSS